MNTELLIYIALFAFVVFRISSRAYSAYQNGFKTWPILALLAVIYTVVAVMRFFMGVSSPVFYIISFGCFLLSRLIYRQSSNSSY